MRASVALRFRWPATVENLKNSRKMGKIGIWDHFLFSVFFSRAFQGRASGGRNLNFAFFPISGRKPETYSVASQRDRIREREREGVSGPKRGRTVPEIGCGLAQTRRVKRGSTNPVFEFFYYVWRSLTRWCGHKSK